MAKKHGARQQKKAARQKARRAEKRAELVRRESHDPTVRLQRAARWPVVRALAGADLWEDGIGYLVIAREEAEGRLVYASFLVDVLCLGVKDSFWDAGTLGDFNKMIERMGKAQAMVPIAPACLVKVVKGAVEFAGWFGFVPHPDFRHTSALLEGIDPAVCPQDYAFGRDGKPFYFRGPNESLAEAQAIAARVREAGGHYVVGLSDLDPEDFDEIEDDDDDLALPGPES
jgi:hypothetical protein